MPRFRLIGGLCAAVAALVMLPAPSASAESDSPAPITHLVQQFGFGFFPFEIYVEPGDTIRWIWGSGHHTVTSGNFCSITDLFNGPLTEADPVFEWTVPADAEGVIPYTCLPHCSFMNGNIVISGVNPCPPDLDFNGVIDLNDLTNLIAGWGPCPPGFGCPLDLDGSGAVDSGDLLLLLNAWGPCR